MSQQEVLSDGRTNGADDHTNGAAGPAPGLALVGLKYDRQKIREIPRLEEGDDHPDTVEVQNYLKHYGYLPLNTSVAAGTLDTPTSQALAKFQAYFKIDSSGSLDGTTKQAMTGSRCGIPDILDPVAFNTAGPWKTRSLKYAFGNLSTRVTGEVARRAIRRALDTWTNAGAGLTFTEVGGNQNPDIFVEWRAANDPDYSMVGGVLAHADFPPGFSIIVTNPPLPCHYDDQEHIWVDSAVVDGFDIETVALHEFGHCLGMYHTDVAGSVMFPSVSSNSTNRSLQPDDLAGIRKLYPPLSGWLNFQLAASPSIAAGTDIAAVSRVPNAMEVWWIAPNGSVQDAFWYEGSPWKQFELAPAGSATSGGIAAVSRISTSMEVWWISRSGSVEGAYWYEGQPWRRYQCAPAGSAAQGTKITAISRRPNTMELWWIGPNGSVQDAFWYEGSPWRRFELAPGGSAAVGGIKAVSRIPSSMEVWWVAPNGSIQDGFFYEGAPWKRFELAPPGSAAIGTGIAAVCRIPTSMEIWWVGPNGSIQDAFFYEGTSWRRFELAPAGSAQKGDIEAVSRIPDSMEVWWTAPNGSVQDAYWYNNDGWKRFELAPPGSAAAGSGIAAVSRVKNSMEIWFSGTSGSIVDYFWYG